MSKLAGMVAGVVGAVAMSMVTGLVRSMGFGLDGDLEMTVGSLFTMTRSTGTWFLGLVGHLLYGGVCGLVYAILFSQLRRLRPRASTGAELGLIHGVLASIVLAFLPRFHPAIPEIMPASVAFFSILGVTVFILVHVMYGALVVALAAPGAWKR